MENVYNVLITYSGDGDFKFFVKRIGEISIAKQRPVYIYNVTAEVINDLRTLRRLLINVIIGAKPEGAYKVYDYATYTDMPRAVAGQRPNIKNVEPISNSEISSILKGGNAPEIIPEVKPEEPKEEVKKEEEKPEAVKTVKKSTKKKTTKKK